jgi:hypothetical protein
VLVPELAVLVEPEVEPVEVLLPELELPEDVLVAVADPALAVETAVPAEKGFAPPDPQPTTEATATIAAPILITALEAKFKLVPLAKLKMQLTETTVGWHLLWLYRRRGLGTVGKIPRLF